MALVSGLGTLLAEQAGRSVPDRAPPSALARPAAPPARLEISVRTLLAGAALVGGIWLLGHLWPVILVITVSLILVGTLNPLVVRCERRGLRRPLAVAIIVLGLVVAGAAFSLLTAPALWRQLSAMVESLPALQRRAIQILAAHPATTGVAEGIARLRPDDFVLSFGQKAMAYSSRAFLWLGYAASSVALALYLLLDPVRAQGGLFAVIPRRFHVRLARILLNLETIVGGYMRGQLLTSALMMGFVFALLTACRVPNALALAVFAGVTDVIPLVGGLIASTPVALSALPRGALTTVIVVTAMVLYQELENRVIIPRVYGRALRLSPAAVTVALLIGGELLGVLGALLALPLAAGLRMVIQELRVELPGDASADTEVRARDERAESAYAELAAGAPAVEAAAIAVHIAADSREDAEAEADDASELQPRH